MNHIFGKIFHKVYFTFLMLKIRKLGSNDTVLKLINDRSIPEAHAHLKQKYDQYINEVSRAEMAASYECVNLLNRVCRLFSYKKLLDLGSGFSSFTFRQYALSDPTIRVWSVDDDAKWIEKTRDYLYQQKVSTENLMMLDEFIAGNEKDFDLIFLDLNFVEVRKNFIKLAVERCKPGGIIIFDDVHKNDFMYDVLRQTSDLSVQLYDIKSLTLDEFGRFALLGKKK